MGEETRVSGGCRKRGSGCSVGWDDGLGVRIGDDGEGVGRGKRVQNRG